VRSYELATLAAARALRSTYCSLAHGNVLATKVLDGPAVTAVMGNAAEAPLEPRERAMIAAGVDRRAASRRPRVIP